MLPPNTQTISLADVDRDGTIDLVFTTCSSVSQSSGLGSDCHINIAYNKQLGLCKSTTDSGVKKGVRVCRPPDDLCTPDPDFKFDFENDSVRSLAFLLLIFLTITRSYLLASRFQASCLKTGRFLCWTPRTIRHCQSRSNWAMPIWTDFRTFC